MRNPPLANGNYFHVFNRGVDKRLIFGDARDFRRFYESLYLFNDANYSNPGNRPLFNEGLLAGSEVLGQFRDPLVRITAFCLLPNHFHMMLYQIQDDGISRFLHKLEQSHAHYFNRKYGRSGALFESAFKAVLIEQESHFQHLPRYIHMNIVDRIEPMWRAGRVEHWSRATTELALYPWSSHGLYLGRRQEIEVVDPHALTDMYGDILTYKRFLKDWATREIPADFPMIDATE